MSQLTKPKKSIKSLLGGDEFRQQVSLALPEHLKPDRFIRIALTALNRTPKLQECTQQSLFQCLLDLSALGLEPDGRRAHLIPYKDQCTLIVDYKGMVELIMRSGNVASIHADVVCENDVFEYDLGQVRKHKVDFRKPRGDVYAAYCIVENKDGSRRCEVMSKDEIEGIRKRSRAGNSGPWATDWSEMAKKGLALDTPIPTPSGWSTMEDLKVGDDVFDMNGEPTKVVAVSEIKRLPCFSIEANGDKIICDTEHRWVARTGGRDACKTPFRVQTINDLHEAKSNGLSVTIPVQRPLGLPDANLPVDPYLLGYWLGDGHSYGASITVSAEDLPHIQEEINQSAYRLGKCREDRTAWNVGIKGGFKFGLREASVLGNKHVPAIYLRASVEQRRALLQGLIDSDGHIDKARGRVHFYNNNQAISDAVYELAVSLGECPHRSTKQMRGFGVECTSYFVSWKPSFICSRLPRKRDAIQPRKISAYRAVSSISQIETVPTKCIAVASSTKTYLAGRSMMPTHNTVFRRASKWVPMPPNITDVLAKEDEEMRRERIVDGTVVSEMTDSGKTVAPALPKAQPEPERPSTGVIAQHLEDSGIDPSDFLAYYNDSQDTDCAGIDDLPNAAVELVMQDVDTIKGPFRKWLEKQEKELAAS